MKVINKMANKVAGTIAESVTASNWKGINYLKKYARPEDPKSELQADTRQYFNYGVIVWHGFMIHQKRAYDFYVRGRKLVMSPFNAMIGSVVRQLSTGPNYLEPPAQKPSVQDFHEHFPLDNADFRLKRAGHSREYAKGISDAVGEISFVVCREDQNYDLRITRAEYQDYAALDIQATAVSDVHYMKLID